MTQDVPGQIILLNGVSSSGKSAIAGELIELLDPPHFHLSIDAFNAMRAKGRTQRLTTSGLDDVLHRTRAGFHRAVAGMARAGNNVVMDYVLSERWRLDDCLEVFSDFRVIFVAVRCELAEVERREVERGDRTLGLARSQQSVVHSFGAYDIEVHSDQMTPSDVAGEISEGLHRVGPITAFDLLRAPEQGL